MKNRWFRRILAGAVSAVLCCGMLAGCGEQSYQPTDALYINTPSAIYLTKYYLEYQESHPGLKFTAEGDNKQNSRFCDTNEFNDRSDLEISEELQTYYDDLKMSLMKAKASDIVTVDDFYWHYDVDPLDYIKMAKAGAFVDMYTLWDQLGCDQSQYDDRILKALEIDGKLYFLPQTVYLFCFETTHKLMEENEFPYDPNDTAIEFLRKCAAWKEAHPNGPEVFSVKYWFYLYQYWYELLDDHVVDYDAEQVNFNREDVKEMLALIKKLKPADFTMDKVNDADWNITYRMDSYHDRSCLFSWYWTSSNLTLEEDDYLLLMPLRQNDGTTMAYSPGSLVAIPSNAENIRNAGGYLTCYLDNCLEGGAYYVNLGLKTEQNKEQIQKVCDANQVNDSYREVVQDAYDQLDQFLVPQSWNYTLDNYMQDYYADKISVDELTRVLQEKMEIYITE